MECTVSLVPEDNSRVRDSVHAANFSKAGAENRRFWRRLGSLPDFQGKRVLDVGCGLGRMCVEAALEGANRVVGLDTDADAIRFAKAHAGSEYPEAADRLEFHAMELADYDGPGFDVILSKDAFEHILDLEGMLREINKRLNPGGRLYAGFGPLYNSPFGHHGRVHTFIPWRRFPWNHLLEDERRVVDRMNRRREAGVPVFNDGNRPIRSIRDLGLNKLSYAELHDLIFHCGLKVERFRTNQSASVLSKVCSALRRAPGLREYFTHNIYCILEKPVRTEAETETASFPAMNPSQLANLEAKE